MWARARGPASRGDASAPWDAMAAAAAFLTSDGAFT